MSYTPNANDLTQPLDTVDRSTAAAEFRTLKTFLNSIVTIASTTTPDIFNATGRLINYTGVGVATGFAAALNAGEQDRILLCAGACGFTAGANLLIDGTTSGNTLTVAAGTVVQVYALTTTQFRLLQISPVVATNATNLVGSGTVSNTATGGAGLTPTNATNLTGSGTVSNTTTGGAALTPTNATNATNLAGTHTSGSIAVAVTGGGGLAVASATNVTAGGTIVTGTLSCTTRSTSVVSFAGTTYTVTATDTYIRSTSTSGATITLPAAASYTGRELFFISAATSGALTSSISNNVESPAGIATNQITTGTSLNSWCHLISNGTRWLQFGNV